MEDVRDLKESQLDAIREVANIGAGPRGDRAVADDQSHDHDHRASGQHTSAGRRLRYRSGRRTKSWREFSCT